jgi:four helix bundle protein
VTNQLQRAAVSVNANIAEGFERIYISKGSYGEIRSLLYLGVTLSKSIASFIRYLKNNPISK